MGNSQPALKDRADLIQHPRLGNVRVFQKEGSEEAFMEYDVPVRSKQDIDQWQKSKQQIQNSETKEVLLLPLSHSFQTSGMCGSSGTLKLIFQDYLFVLQSEIQNRADINKPFMQTEMCYLLYNIVRAGKEYEKHERKIGDIQPANIVINEDGQTKIISVDSWPGQQTNFEKVVAQRTVKAFLAPQQCVQQFLKRGEYPPNVNRSVAEAFSVGMTLLEAASLRDCSELYYKTGDLSINQDDLKRTIDSIRGLYSPNLVNSIDSLLSIDPRSRSSCGQIHAVFAPYEVDIMNLDQFTFDPISSQKCLQTFHKFNPKSKSSQWSFNKLIGRPGGSNNPNLGRQTYNNQIVHGVPGQLPNIPTQVVYTTSAPRGVINPNQGGQQQYVTQYNTQYR